MLCAWEFIVVELKAMCVSCIVSKSLYRDRDSEYFLHFFSSTYKILPVHYD